MIDTDFDFYTDARGKDPDSTSPTLRKYHILLWSKFLPNGKKFELTEGRGGVYLYHKSELGEFFLGSDAITHSYKNHKQKQWLIHQVQNEADELFKTGSTIGAYILFPNNKINRMNTINQARGVNRKIDDRFDLTLECIRRFYINQTSPLYHDLLRYKDFFHMFESFIQYVNFFLLNDLLDDNQGIKFYLPFDDFETPPKFSDVNDYLVYKTGVMNFIRRRNQRIKSYNMKL